MSGFWALLRCCNVRTPSADAKFYLYSKCYSRLTCHRLRYEDRRYGCRGRCFLCLSTSSLPTSADRSPLGGAGGRRPTWKRRLRDGIGADVDVDPWGSVSQSIDWQEIKNATNKIVEMLTVLSDTPVIANFHACSQTANWKHWLRLQAATENRTHWCCAFGHIGPSAWSVLPDSRKRGTHSLRAFRHSNVSTSRSVVLLARSTLLTVTRFINYLLFAAVADDTFRNRYNKTALEKLR